ncbi:hypothetical protein GQX74_012982 [Glossina fuscipes]|nr:hypothetical protein GQX74_012982 [Glossina fuscipes]
MPLIHLASHRAVVGSSSSSSSSSSRHSKWITLQTHRLRDTENDTVKKQHMPNFTIEDAVKSDIFVQQNIDILNKERMGSRVDMVDVGISQVLKGPDYTIAGSFIATYYNINVAFNGKKFPQLCFYCCNIFSSGNHPI